MLEARSRTTYSLTEEKPMRQFNPAARQYSYLFYKLNCLFTDTDELGLSLPGTEDCMPHIEQYDNEVSTIIPRIMDEEVQSEEQVLDIIYEEMADWFDESFVSPKERWTDLSKKTWEILLSLSNPEEEGS